MKLRLRTASLLTAICVLFCGCSGGQHASDLVSGTTTAKSAAADSGDSTAENSDSTWGDVQIDDTEKYDDLYEKGTVDGQLYTNERYKFKTMFPDNFTLYDYDGFAQRIKESNNLTDAEYKSKVTVNEMDYVYLFRAENDAQIYDITYEIMLLSYVSCQTNLLSVFSQKMYEHYSTYQDDSGVKSKVLSAENVMFGGNQAYRLDVEFTTNDVDPYFYTVIIFCVNDYFANVSLYSNEANGLSDEEFKAAFDKELADILAATADINT